METKKLKEHYKTLFLHFSDPFRQGSEGTIYDRILDLFKKEEEYMGKIIEQEYKKSFKEGEKANDNFIHLRNGLKEAAFSYGFVIGRLLDPAWCDAKEAEEAILDDIKENELLLYLPRQKGERRMR